MLRGREQALVTIVDKGGRSCGVGVLIGDRHVMTCAHVVNCALGRGKASQDKPADEDEIELRFALLPGTPRRFAVTDMWQPPSSAGITGGPLCDLAGLVLRGEGPPGDAVVARLGEEPGDEVAVFGYPVNPPRPQGAWVDGRLLGSVGGGRRQLDSALAATSAGYVPHTALPGWREVCAGDLLGMSCTRSADRGLDGRRASGSTHRTTKE